MQQSLSATVDQYRAAAGGRGGALGAAGHSIAGGPARQVTQLAKSAGTKSGPIVVGTDRVRFPRINIQGNRFALVQPNN